MKKFLCAAGALAVTFAGAAANAAPVIYDASSSFTGTSTGGQFTYGTFDGTNFTAFNDAPGCASLISGTVCTSNGNLPAAFKSTTGAHQSGTVIVPASALILHPGPNAGQASAVVFTGPTSGNYKVAFSSFVADTNPSGVNILGIIPGVAGFPLATLTASNPAFSFSGNTFLAAGSKLGFAVDYDGVYYNDSTGINFSVSGVPEPMTWALMVVGFGLVGVGMRRKVAASGLGLALPAA